MTSKVTERDAFSLSLQLLKKTYITFWNTFQLIYLVNLKVSSIQGELKAEQNFETCSW